MNTKLTEQLESVEHNIKEFSRLLSIAESTEEIKKLQAILKNLENCHYYTLKVCEAK